MCLWVHPGCLNDSDCFFTLFGVSCWGHISLLASYWQALDEVLELVSKIYKLRADTLEQQVAEEKAREQELLQQVGILLYSDIYSRASGKR